MVCNAINLATTKYTIQAMAEYCREIPYNTHIHKGGHMYTETPEVLRRDTTMITGAHIGSILAADDRHKNGTVDDTTILQGLTALW